MSLTTPSDFYKDFYFYKYVNGSRAQEIENIPFEAPRDLNYFLEQFKCEDISSDGNEDQASMGPTIISYKAGHPVQDSEMVRLMEGHRILTRVI